MAYTAQQYATAIWEAVSRTLRSSADPYPSTRLGWYTDEIWTEATRRLTADVDDGNWTTIPSAGATCTVVYVSSSAGNDDNDGSTPELAVATIARAKTLFGASTHPAWLLLKRGDTWTEAISYWTWSGISTTDISLIGTYGSGARPILKTGDGNGITFQGGGGAPATMDHVYIVGVDFYAHTRDPDSPDYVGQDGGIGIYYARPGVGLLIEDCVVRWYTFNISVNGTDLADLVIRRNIITDAYPSTGFSSGVFVDGVAGGVIEENFADKNGWNAAAGKDKTIFDHNFYITLDNTEIAFRKNITANASSHGCQQRCRGECTDNLYIANPIGHLLGGGAGAASTSLVRHNVVLDGNDIGAANRGFGFEVTDRPYASVRQNIIAHVDSADAFGKSIHISAGTDGTPGVSVTGNIIYDWNGSSILDQGTDTVLSGNVVDGEGYSAPDRSIGSYAGSIGFASTTNAFLAACRARTIGQWNTDLSAPSANLYIAAGFDEDWTDTTAPTVQQVFGIIYGGSGLGLGFD